jgi:hypothetical protein
MGIQHEPGKSPLAPPAPLTWGEIAPEGQPARVVRFCLVDRVVTFPVSELRRWEHAVGAPELLTIHVGRETVVVEGSELAAVRTSLDLGRLCELRLTHSRLQSRPGPKVLSISIEAA